MFSEEPRVIYENNQLADVICQLRFPTILAISAREPVDFQEAVRQLFPRYSVRQDPVPPRVVQVPGQPPKMEPQKPVTNHQFVTADSLYRINLTQNFISLTCSKYTCWEDFANKMDRPLASFIKAYAPAYFERVGLRYLNAFSKEELGLEQSHWRDLLEPAYLGLLGEETAADETFSRCSQDAEMALGAGCRMKLHVGPGLLKRGGKQEETPRLIFDMDVSMTGNIPVNMAAGAMQTVHDQAGRVFRDAITDTLHDAMEPKDP